MMERNSSSFRDPAGFVFSSGGAVFRAVKRLYQADYDLLMQSGLYDALVSRGYLIDHVEEPTSSFNIDDVYKIIKPRQIGFISYPYEWCFSQLQDAALCTLHIQRIALEHGMVLKDANALNMQFVGGRPCLVDTLSFQKYEGSQPWIAYRQFCESFLATLALASNSGSHWIQFMKIYPDGIPLAIASRELPLSSNINLGVLLHIKFHARSNAADRKQLDYAPRHFRMESHFGLLSNLEHTIQRLQKPKADGYWSRYYSSNVSAKYFEAKKTIVTQLLVEAHAKHVWDLGANDGCFSRIAARQGAEVISLDSDHDAVTQNYLKNKSDGIKNILPLVVDISNPTPAIGWKNSERASFPSRGPTELLLALAILHHLAIRHYISLDEAASLCADLCRTLIIEFVPKADPCVQDLLFGRPDIFDNYTIQEFELAFSRQFRIVRSIQIPDSQRTLYLMAKR